MKRIILLLGILALCCFNANAKGEDAKSVAQKFGVSLHDWARTKNKEYLLDAQDLCMITMRGHKDECTKVADKFIDKLYAVYMDAPLTNYSMNDFIEALQEGVERGIDVLYSGFDKVSESNVTFSKNSKNNTEANIKKYDYVSCSVDVSGSIDLKEDVLFYIRKKDSKIAKIANYERTSSGKAKIDLSDLDVDDDEMIGFSYNYAKNFPIGVSAIYSISNFMVSLDFGLNTSSDKTVSEKLNMTNVLNYSYKKTELDPKMYLTITPAYYMKYFSVGCGIGGLMLNKTTTESSSTSSGIGSTETSGGTVKFMLRPVIKGYIPVNDNKWAISLGVGYDIVFGYKKMNGINFSAGLLFNLD